jgi:hypothetical protein
VGSFLFPQKRADGSFCVAIRFAVLREDAAREVRERLQDWIEKKEQVDHLDMAEEFTRPPFADVAEPSSIQIVFEGKPSSTLWKGLMIELARELGSVGGIRRLGFWDLVTGVSHPASVIAAGSD